MKYTSHLKQLSVDMFRSSFDDLDKNNRWVRLGDILPCQAQEEGHETHSLHDISHVELPGQGPP